MSRRASSSADARGSRRSFLQQTAASAAALAWGDSWCHAANLSGSESPDAESDLLTLSEHVHVYCGPVQVGIVRDGHRALLIDCGDGSVDRVLTTLGIRSVEQILCTHHHRDQVCGASRWVDKGARIAVGQAERQYFDNPAEYWDEDAHLWRVYRSFRPHPLMLTEPLRVDQTLVEGQEIRFGAAKIRVTNTPGHTDGSISFVVDADGQRVIFCGDLMAGAGQIWDVYSLQRGFERGGDSVGGYHGFMGDQSRLKDSLSKVVQQSPAVLVPSHGPVIRQPEQAVRLLTERLDACYENYTSISALRHYFPNLLAEFAGRPSQMPIRPGLPVPDCLRHFGTTWTMVSESGGALVMDVGSDHVVKHLQGMLDREEIRSIDGLWVTHYHFDHTDGIPLFQKTFDCPTYVDRTLAQVLQQPRAWRLPCLATMPIRIDHLLDDGQSWQWREFKLTSYFYPGQTLYHAALLAERDDLRMLFVGDSHTMAGNDDYCAQNRNFLGRGKGFQYCLSLIEKLQPTHMFNCHVQDAFTFTDDEIRFMRQALDRREQLVGQLVPWDHANYGTDDSWVRCFPYTQIALPGSTVKIDVVVTNHAEHDQATRCRAVLPSGWGGEASDWQTAIIPAGHEQSLSLTIKVPADLQPGRVVIPVDIQHGRWQLPQFREAILDVRAV
jgi:glyoxylase-like metal-dependent hydrolase (beta-lactamase superfamily II)